MLSPPPSVRLHVATQPIDGRKGVDSLMVIVRDVFGHDPFEGHLFVFFSKRCDRVRIVYWDRDGFAMWTKRLERGRYKATFAEDGRLTASSIEAAETRSDPSRARSSRCPSSPAMAAALDEAGGCTFHIERLNPSRARSSHCTGDAR